MLGNSENEKLIFGDMFALEWIKEIDTQLPTIIVVSGVYQYFDKDKIVDVDCNATLRLTKDYVHRLFLNHNIIEDEELLKKEVTTRYFGSSTKAILSAYHDALQRYKKVKAELIKER